MRFLDGAAEVYGIFPPVQQAHERVGGATKPGGVPERAQVDKHGVPGTKWNTHLLSGRWGAWAQGRAFPKEL